MTVYGIAELAAAVGVSSNTMSQWIRRGKVPPPSATLAAGPVWYGRKVEAWIASRRPPP